MTTLIIHHLESMWESGYQQFGESFEGLCEKVLLYIQEHEADFDQIILTRFEDNRLENVHHWTGLADYINQVEDYGYGWTKESIEYLDDDDWCEGGQHSEIVMVDEWMKSLRGKVAICGAFDGECIDDLETALDHLEVDYDRIEELII